MDPFRIEIPQQDLDDLHHKLANTRWPTEHPDTTWNRGVPQHYLKELTEYWHTTYNWRTAEAHLNTYPQYTTTIDGTNIHYLHIRSPEPHALPLLITHGWPGSFTEFLTIIEPLTNPRKHNANPHDAFHLVIPTIPGFGFSGPTPDTGWTIPRVAQTWTTLMHRLNYHHYAVQGGDLGALISLEVCGQDAGVIGAHVNFLITRPSGADGELDNLSAQDRARLARIRQFDEDQPGYMKLQSTRPRTLSYGLTDSPVGQLAWIIEKFKEWTDSDKAPEDAINRDQLLTNVMIYWLTATAGTSADLYFEIGEQIRAALAGHDDPGRAPVRCEVPVGVAVFPHDIVAPIRQLADREFPNITHWTEFDRGGHFAAMEQPGLLIEDVRDFLRQHRGKARPASTTS